MALRLKLIRQMLNLGCAVFPVVKGGQKRAVKGGFKAASKDLSMIDKYFTKNPNANYGVATGAPSKVFVVDLDGSEGFANFRRLQKAYGTIPTTLTVKTPHGWHLYFRGPDHRVPCRHRAR
jgi:hypothetical protein